MAEQPNHFITFSAKGFSDTAHEVSEYLSKKSGSITATDPEAKLVAGMIARGENQEGLLHKLTSLSEKFHTEEGTKKVLERLGVNENTLRDKDFRIVLCNSSAGPVCFQGKETKDGLELIKSLSLSLPAGTEIVGALLQSQDKDFKPLPEPKLIAKSDIDQNGLIMIPDDGVLEGVLTSQGAKNILPVIKMIKLADQTAQGTNANQLDAPTGFRIVPTPDSKAQGTPLEAPTGFHIVPNPSSPAQGTNQLDAPTGFRFKDAKTPSR